MLLNIATGPLAPKHCDRPSCFSTLRQALLLLNIATGPLAPQHCDRPSSSSTSDCCKNENFSSKCLLLEPTFHYPSHSFSTCGGPEAQSSATIFRKCVLRFIAREQECYIQKANPILSTIFTHAPYKYHFLSTRFEQQHPFIAHPTSSHASLSTSRFSWRVTLSRLLCTANLCRLEKMHVFVFK